MMDCMQDMTGMMWGMGIVGFLTLAVLILIAMALIKYLFFSERGRRHDH